ncbi:MAG: DUF1761 domain-containing protein [Candidatus Moraniibacteriota bacterium]|nr:MAG: DUF1761 domain-containing protein [Candidatus Moranbacteria bacterium]
MELNYVAIVAATVLQFISGWVWYMAIFGRAWGEMHGYDKLSKEEQDKAQKEMGPQLGLQFLGTLLTTVMLALFMAGLPAEWNPYGIAGFFWLGFVLPTQASAVMFGGTPKQYMLKKTVIMAGGSLVSLMIAAAMLSFFPS